MVTISGERSHWSCRTRAALLRAGWFPRRRVDVSLFLNNRFRLFLHARLVLKEFGGLEFRSDSCRVVIRPDLVNIKCEDLLENTMNRISTDEIERLAREEADHFVSSLKFINNRTGTILPGVIPPT
jgi:hypothetical protein